MDIISKIKKELFDNKKKEESIRRSYKISFEELATLLNTNDPIIKIEICEDKNNLLIETQSKGDD